MLRLIISASLFTIASLSGAHATDFGCNPAIQNWVNGSHTTCPFESNSRAPEPARPPAAVTPPPPPTSTEEPVG